MKQGTGSLDPVRFEGAVRRKVVVPRLERLTLSGCHHQVCMAAYSNEVTKNVKNAMLTLK